jgi:putative redox protein
MIAHCEWKGNGYFDGQSMSGQTVHFDTSEGQTGGPTPMEVVLMGLCGCTSVDVVSILQKKRQPLTGLRVSAHADRAPEPPRVFTHIHLTYTVSGEVSHKAVEDAVRLSNETYCSVSKMLEKAAEIDYEIVYNDAEKES